MMTMFGLMMASSSFVFAQSAPPAPDVRNLFNQIPGPVSNFIQSAQKIGTDFSIGNTWFKANDWFSHATGGTSVIDALKIVGNLLVWLFSALVDLIRWGLSLL